jgi:hypothetical protein
VPLIDGFVHPALLAGAALASVPLIIHLLNRQRYKPMPWAAMRFVLAAYRRTRRRARLENLLLLLLRMAVIALLALAISRPFTGSRSPLAGLAESRRDVVLVLDASASTGYRAGVESVYERIVARAKEIALELDGARDDRVRVLVAGAQPRLVAWRRPDEALSVIATLDAPADEPLDLAAALGEVVRFAQEDTQHSERSSLEIRLLTDLQKRSFEAAPGEGEDKDDAPALVEQLDALSKLGARVLVEDLGPGEAVPPNLGIDAVETVSPILGAQATCEIAVSVRNFGDAPRSGVRVSLTVGEDQRLPFRPIDIPAHGSAKATFPVVFPTSGAHALHARIESDRLAFDDVRSEVVLVPPPTRVLLVDGEPAGEIEADEVGYLFAVLDPPRGDEILGGSGASPFEPRSIEPHDLRDEQLDLADFDVIVLANVESVPADVVERLERWTAAGGALIATLGKRVDAAGYNARLHRADGSGLLPVELGSRAAIARRDGYFRAREFQLDHPAFSFFADQAWRPLLTEVPIYEMFTSTPDENARVLAWLDDDARSPLLVEKSYDRGKTFVWTTSIDPEWTRLPESPKTLVPLVHEWFRHAADPSAPPRNVGVGAAIVAEVETFPRNPSLVLPDGARRALETEPEPIGPGLWRVAALGATERAGIYSLEIEGANPEPFAAQADAAEGDLERVAPAELASLHPALELVGGDARAEREQDDEASTKGELWRGVAIACFVALVLETLWAAWLGRSRRIA